MKSQKTEIQTSRVSSGKPLFRRLAGWKMLIVLFSMALAAGCGTTRYGVASFQSTQEDVQVFDMEDGTVIGSTPINFLWRSKEAKRKYMNVRMHKDGYKDAIKAFWLSLDYRSAKAAHKNPQLITFELEKAGE